MMKSSHISFDEVRLASAFQDGASTSAMYRGTWQSVTGEFVLVEECNPGLHEGCRSKCDSCCMVFLKKLPFKKIEEHL
jgi:hypothetical protein